MRIGRLLLSVLAIQLSLTGCAWRLGKMTDSQKAERLAVEKGKLAELTDPVEIARSQIVISRILLDFVSSSIDKGQTDGIDRRFAQYLTSLQAARDALVKSGQDPVKRAGGCRELEAATRRYSHTLAELGPRLNDDLRPHLEKARNTTDSIHAEMLNLISVKSVRNS